jgi:hypothetical protein
VPHAAAHLEFADVDGKTKQVRIVVLTCLFSVELPGIEPPSNSAHGMVNPSIG